MKKYTGIVVGGKMKPYSLYDCIHFNTVELFIIIAPTVQYTLLYYIRTRTRDTEIAVILQRLLSLHYHLWNSNKIIIRNNKKKKNGTFSLIKKRKIITKRVINEKKRGQYNIHYITIVHQSRATANACAQRPFTDVIYWRYCKTNVKAYRAGLNCFFSSHLL